MQQAFAEQRIKRTIGDMDWFTSTYPHMLLFPDLNHVGISAPLSLHGHVRIYYTLSMSYSVRVATLRNCKLVRRQLIS